MRDVPDVLGFADYAGRPDLTLPLVHERITTDTLFVDHHRFPLPKVNGSVRGLTVMSPVTELALRTYVGRCSAAIQHAIDERRVLNGLIRQPGPGWYSADFREQHRVRREMQRHHYEVDATQAVGFLDVENFFPSCRHDWLGDKLEELRAPGGAVAVLVAMLSSLFTTGTGLPIGFEGSGPLANLFLLPLDTALAKERLDFVRWTDDVDVFLPTVEWGPALLNLAAATLADVGLRLNHVKSRVMAKGAAAEQRLLDPSRDSIFGDDAIEGVKSRLDLQLWLKELGWVEDLPPAHFRSYLGLLRHDGDPGALAYLVEVPSWVDRESRAVGDYLAELSHDPAARSALDPDWMMERAIGRTPEKDTAAGQLHMCRALAEYRLDANRAADLLGFATRPEVLFHNPVLGAWALRAWSASQGWNKSDAMSVVDAIAHTDYRRSAIIGFAGRQPSKPALLRDRARTAPEIAPVVELALAT